MYVSTPAKRRLEALRSSVEVGLAALEAALADPARGDALEALILDLSRVATEEAQATAAHACVDTRLEAEMHIGQARAAAQAAIDQEHAASADVRRALDQARQRIVTLEQEKAEDLRTARDWFNGELAREQASKTEVEQAVAKLEQTVADVQRELELERSAAQNLREEIERADRRTNVLTQELAHAASIRERIEAELARAHDGFGESQRAHADTQAELDRQRKRNAELERAQSALETQFEAERHTTVDFGKAHADVQARFDAERAASADLRRELAELRARFDADRRTTAELTHAYAEMQARLQAERASSTELRRSAARAEDLAEAGANEVREALAHSRAEVQSLRDDLEGARSRIEALSGEHGDADRLWKETESRLKRAERERDDLVARLVARTPSEPHTPSETPARPAPDPTPLTAPPHPVHKATHKPRTKAAAKMKEPEAGWVAVRLSERFGFGNPLAVQVNGIPGELCDLSTGGCQVLSSTRIKPNQAVKLLIHAEPTPISCTGKVVWAKLEAPGLDRPAGYRAGVQFVRPDESRIESFIGQHGGTLLT